MMLLRWLALVALLFSASWLLTLAVEVGASGAAANNPAVVLTTTALLGSVTILLTGSSSGETVHGGTRMQKFRCGRSDTGNVTLPESLKQRSCAERRIPRTGWALLAIFMALTIYV